VIRKHRPINSKWLYNMHLIPLNMRHLTCCNWCTNSSKIWVLANCFVSLWFVSNITTVVFPVGYPFQSVASCSLSWSRTYDSCPRLSWIWARPQLNRFTCSILILTWWWVCKSCIIRINNKFNYYLKLIRHHDVIYFWC